MTIYSGDQSSGVWFGNDNITGLSPYSISTNKSSSGGSSQSGINWNSQFMKQLSPMLTQSAAGAVSSVGNMGQELQGKYGNMMRQSMAPDAFQGTLNSLAGRGMLNSKVASDSMATAGRGVAQDIGNQYFNSMLGQYDAQMKLPAYLAQLAQLGQESRSASGSSSEGYSYSANPLAPYQLAKDLMAL